MLKENFDSSCGTPDTIGPYVYKKRDIWCIRLKSVTKIWFCKNIMAEYAATIQAKSFWKNLKICKLTFLTH